MSYVVNCRECDFYSIEDDFIQADLQRDNHEMSLFGESNCKGECVIAKIEEKPPVKSDLL